MRKLAVALTLTLVGVVMAGGAAQAQDSGSYNGDLSRTPTLSLTVVSPGGEFTVTVGCLVGETVVFDFEGTTVSVVCADNGSSLTESVTSTESLNGTASATFNAPATTGTFTGTAAFPAAPTESFTISVQGVSATTNPSGGLPATGSDGTGPTIMIAAILLLSGVGMFGVAQRRRRVVTSAAA